MRKGILVVGVLLVLAAAVGGLRVLRNAQSARDAASAPERTTRGAVSEAYGRVPLHFEANRGQTDEKVKFLTRGRGYTMFLTANEAVLVLSQPASRDRSDRRSLRRHPEPRRDVKRTVLRMTFAGANPKPRVDGREQLPGKVNYFIGNDPAKWRANVPTYARVQYADLYPGIDLVYYGNQRAVEYDFVVAPGADPSRIALGFEGADKMEIDASGDLVLHTRHGALRQRKPFIYQEAEGARREISGGYVVVEGSVRFQVAAYDATRPLVIDPALFYSTYLGGNNAEQGIAIAVDDAGSAFVTGSTESTDFPTTTGAFDVTHNGGGQDVFVTKLDATGSELVYSTYLGGNGDDLGSGVAVDVPGNAYISGQTGSSDFPVTPLAFDTTFNSGEAFVLKLDPAGSGLVYATYLGGSSGEQGGRIAIDTLGNAYTTGSTSSTDFPTIPAAYDTTYNGGDSDAFVAKLNPAGSELLYGTYLGGSGSEFGEGIRVDATGTYVVGLTTSSDFPTTMGAFDTMANGDEGFVTKLDPSGSVLSYSTYLGGSPPPAGGTGSEGCLGIAVDVLGNAYVQGFTDATDFPTTMGAFDTTFDGDSDVFVTKLNAAGSGLLYSTYLGGTGLDQSESITADAMGQAHVTGWTDSSNFPVTPGAFTSGGGFDAFVTKLSSDGSALVYSTYLGGIGDEFALDIALDDLPVPNAFVIGSTESPNFPTTPGAFDASRGGFSDAFVAEVADVVLPPTPTTGRVQGSGTIAAGKFHLLALAHNDGTFSGKVQYTSNATNARVKSETINLLVINGNMATIEGTCTVDGMPCTFRVDVTDDPDTTDTFAIQVSSGLNEGGPLTKGNIRIQQ